MPHKLFSKKRSQVTYRQHSAASDVLPQAQRGFRDHVTSQRPSTASSERGPWMTRQRYGSILEERAALVKIGEFPRPQTAGSPRSRSFSDDSALSEVSSAEASTKRGKKTKMLFAIIKAAVRLKRSPKPLSDYSADPVEPNIDRVAEVKACKRVSLLSSRAIHVRSKTAPTALDVFGQSGSDLSDFRPSIEASTVLSLDIRRDSPTRKRMFGARERPNSLSR